MHNIRKHWMRLASVALVSFGVAACSDRAVSPTAVEVTAGGAALNVVPGTPDWLAPLGTGVADPATFDAAGADRVQICVWSGSACVGAPVAKFATAPVAGELPLVANTSAGQFEASWNLMSTSFLSRKTYRIAAMKSGVELRSILVDVVRGRWGLTRTDGTLAPLVTASDLPIVFHVAVVTPPSIVINEVESSGGTPGDWVELMNTGSTTVNLSGFVIKDDNDTHVFTIASGTMIAPGAYLAFDVEVNYGLGSADAARLFLPSGVLLDSYNWTAHAATTYGRCPNGTGAFTTTTAVTKGAANNCSVPNTVVINEIESSGGTPGDWVELTNTGASTVNIGGYVIKDDNDSHIFTIPTGTTIAAGAYLVFDVEVSYGLGAPDAARLFKTDGTLLDSYSWTTHATTTYGRCPNGSGAFATTTSVTRGSANVCAGQGPVTESWPGLDNATPVDALGMFSSNLSGLIYESGAGPGGVDVLWGAQNGPGSIHRMVFNGSIWVRDVNNGWANGKLTHYMNGTGEPDTEDLTFTTGSMAGMYIASERNNQASSVSRPSILRYDVSGSSTELTATNEWVLTSDLPVVAANSGLEGITWIPDATLLALGFYDNAAGHLYNPAEYPNHAGGLFAVGLEGNGMVYVYALDHVTNGFTRITSFTTGFPSGVMSLQFDRELNQLWATCDDTCGGLSDIFTIDTGVGSPTRGQFKLTHIYARPSTLPNVNNEGFAFAPQAACVGGFKAAFWADDNATGGNSLRRAAIPCVVFP